MCAHILASLTGFIEGRTTHCAQTGSLCQPPCDQPPLLNDGIGNREHAGRKGEAERFGSFQIDDKFELGCLDDGEVRWLFSLQDAADLHASQAVIVRQIAAVTGKATCLHKLTPFRDRGQVVTRREPGNFLPPAIEEGIGRDKHRIDILLRESIERCIYFAVIAGFERDRRPTQSERPLCDIF